MSVSALEHIGMQLDAATQDARRKKAVHHNRKWQVATKSIAYLLSAADGVFHPSG
jgi:hypothetical protein